MIDTALGSAPLLDFLPRATLPDETLLELTGDKSKLRALSRESSGLEDRVAVAWEQPLKTLSCGQCRMLVGQRLGLRWLAAPIAEFVALYPSAECDLYPGDLAVNALIAGKDILEYAPNEAAAMFAADFSWLDNEIADAPSDDLLRRARDRLIEGRKSVRLSG
ncbi:hypothetical protein [Sphingobium sp. Ant17]|jgi:hypothetical protein|uniref:hypothetical protein n=1 Tax=Sphingobium sp. Ant17 TaxID=1461752 RepID=UPI0004522A4A|nr:hypothetical protein [Sphingobium sp. Ant17]EXS70422.1 hypothetical protein BF95_00260 [Sphingobium sp. Ant17]